MSAQNLRMPEVFTFFFESLMCEIFLFVFAFVSIILLMKWLYDYLIFIFIWKLHKQSKLCSLTNEFDRKFAKQFILMKTDFLLDQIDLVGFSGTFDRQDSVRSDYMSDRDGRYGIVQQASLESTDSRLCYLTSSEVSRSWKSACWPLSLEYQDPIEPWKKNRPNLPLTLYNQIFRPLRATRFKFFLENSIQYERKTGGSFVSTRKTRCANSKICQKNIIRVAAKWKFFFQPPTNFPSILYSGCHD